MSHFSSSFPSSSSPRHPLTDLPPSSPQHSSDDNMALREVITLLKGEIQHLRKEKADLQAQKAPKKNDPRIKGLRTTGRQFYRVVHLFESAHVAVSEGLDHEAAMANNEWPPEELDDDASEEEKLKYDDEIREGERAHDTYKAFRKLIPELDSVVLSDNVKDLYASIMSGATDGRSEDLKKITVAVAEYVNERQYKMDMAAAVAVTDLASMECGSSNRIPEPLTVPKIQYVDPTSRQGRGFQNDVCGFWLCPVGINWLDESIRAKLRNGDNIISDGVELDLSQEVAIPLFYKNGKSNEHDLEDGLFMTMLLVKLYQIIFTAPSSVEDEAADDNDAEPDNSGNGPRKRLRKAKNQTASSRETNAEKSNLNGKVTGRSIAYIACLAYFGLTNAANWRTPLGNSVSLPYMYTWAVDFFEGPKPGSQARARADRVLEWWNKKVFPRHVSRIIAHPNGQSSSQRMRAQRAAKENVRA
ncbi:unnamed protein product [Mycena citricolor]|uniref:Uncharacterized protein n=1 Tax=Mycena citricolor TaxID=2018698 RepID=A0AAD2GZN6_9AGAR|nr:unnamed protein product [Mycena citricolor]